MKIQELFKNINLFTRKQNPEKLQILIQILELGPIRIVTGGSSISYLEQSGWRVGDLLGWRFGSPELDFGCSAALAALALFLFGVPFAVCVLGLSGTRRATRNGIRASAPASCEVAASAAPAISAGLAPCLPPRRVACFGPCSTHPNETPARFDFDDSPHFFEGGK
jgi:hypothetical protein